MQFDFQDMEPLDRYELLLGTVLPRPITIVTQRRSQCSDLQSVQRGKSRSPGRDDSRVAACGGAI
jgi:hypothetical protein